MDNGLLDTALQGAGALFMAVAGLFIRGHAARIRKIETDADADVKDLAGFKLDSEKRFAKEETMQKSLARIHDRLDTLPREILNLIKHSD